MSMPDALTIRELLDPSYMRAENVIRRAHAANTRLGCAALGELVGYPASTVRSVLGDDADDDDAAPASPRRSGRLGATNPAGTTIKPWEAESFEREKKRKAAAEKHTAWLVKKGVKPVSPQEDTPPTRTRPHSWRDNGYRT
jgi:hypothetical protein